MPESGTYGSVRGAAGNSRPLYVGRPRPAGITWCRALHVPADTRHNEHLPMSLKLKALLRRIAC